MKVLRVCKVIRRKPVGSNSAAQLRFAKLRLSETADFWNDVLWTHDTKHLVHLLVLLLVK